MTKKITFEGKTVEAMIRMHCNSVHHRKTLCDECKKLMIYTEKRTENCRFGNEKPACKNCPVHCYSPEMKEKIREVMRSAGPKMIYKHPVMAFYHCRNSWSFIVSRRFTKKTRRSAKPMITSLRGTS